MSDDSGQQTSRNRVALILLIAAFAAGVVAAERLILRKSGIRSASGPGSGQSAETSPADVGNHFGHDHDHGTSDHEAHSHHGHSHEPTAAAKTDHESNALRLSEEALRNVGLFDEEIRTVRLTTYWKVLSLPAEITERAGRTQLQIAAPMTGIVTEVHVPDGAAVDPGTLLFRIRLTHEDLLQLQTEFLQTIEELDVEEREIRRLAEVTRTQAIPGQILLEREYERDNLMVLKAAQHESLRFHGLTERHLESIIRNRQLIRELRIYAPDADSTSKMKPGGDAAAGSAEVAAVQDSAQSRSTPRVLGQLRVHPGQVVSAGTTLCVLKDYSELLLQGLAFQQDVEMLREALQAQREVTAVFSGPGRNPQLINDLRIEHLANQVDAESRSVRFVLRLSNQLQGDREHNGNRYIEWKWLVGQRLQLRVPLRRWPKQIVVPKQAVTQVGSESYIFRKHGRHFDRIAIRIRHRDPLYVVVERDGAISPGNEIAWRSADLMQMALRNRSSEPVDPHHGHNH